MRKTLILTLVLCLAAVVAYAQTGTSGSGAAAGASASTGTTGATTGTTGATTGTGHKAHKATKAAKHKTVKGTIASVDATAKSFVVHPAKGADVTVKVNDKTKYTPKGDWDEIKADVKVTVTYHNDGTDNWALTIHFAATKAAKPAAAPKTTGK